MTNIPEYWINFINELNLEEHDFEIPEEMDLSEMGAALKLFGEKEIESEMNEYYPGLIVKDHGFIPVACCLLGSGDPYLINSNDGPGGPLYRIYHDSVHDHNYKKEDAIDVVISNYNQLKSFL